MHKTGYHVWAHGQRSWHRTLKGAEQKVIEVSNWCSDAHIVEVATGDRVRNDNINDNIGENQEN